LKRDTEQGGRQVKRKEKQMAMRKDMKKEVESG
jgi:hypothetical protein